MSDEELMRSYQSGSESAFEALYRQWSPKVWAFIRRRLKGSEAGDLYQKVWRQLHEKRELYKGQPFGPWFFVLIRHLLIDEYRYLGRRREFHSELMERLAQQQEPEKSDLEELLGGLSPEVRRLVSDHYLQGLEYSELAGSTGLTEANIRQKISRGIRGIREKGKGAS
jgi:RNA polymerase sigma factor (sigma-70 family)